MVSEQTTRAEQLCAAHQLDVGQVFAQQFRIAAQKLPSLPGFRRFEIDKWFVDAGPDLPCVALALPDARSTVILFGIAVDTKGAVVETGQLARLANSSDAVDYLNHCAGRFAFAVISENDARLYLDPLGSLGAVYDQQDHCVASTLNLVLHRDLISNDDYPFAAQAAVAEARFAFGHTPDKFVKRLLPNHYLDLTTLTQHRFWPGEDDIIDAGPADEQRLLDLITSRLGQIISSLASHFPETKLPISGGLDSRVLLACAKPALSQISLYSHAENMMSRKDTRIARVLAQKLDQPFEVFDPLRDGRYAINDTTRLKTLSNSHHIAVGEGEIGTLVAKVRLEVLEALPRGGLVLRGNGVDFLKAVLWRRGVNEYLNGQPHHIVTGLRMMMLADSDSMASLSQTKMKDLHRSYEDWFGALDGVAAKRAFDIMFAEQFLSHGAGNMFYGYTRNFYIYPFNDRRLLAAATSLSPVRRTQLCFTEAIVAALAPELQTVKYTRKAVQAHLTSKRQADPDWFR